MRFHCHNCLVDWPFSHFLQEYAADIYQDYVFEKYKELVDREESYNEFDFKPHFEEKVNDVSILDGYTSVDKLPVAHFCRLYVQKRQIPEVFWKDIWYVPDFKKLVDQFEPENEYQLKPEDARVVFPFRDQEKRITAIQGRSFQSRGLRYITIKVDHDAPKIFGLDRVAANHRVYVVEGPIDSLCIPNSIACAGSNLGSIDLSIFNDLVFIYDFEPRNKQIIESMKKIADSPGKKICVWPDEMPGKDINDFILAGMTKERVINIIDKNIYEGINARIAINEFKRC